MVKAKDVPIVDEEKEALAETVISSEVIALVEKAVRADNTASIKLIQPGWGSSGYYGPEVLERDGPKVFTKGLKKYWNHATDSEDADRPEGSLDNLAGELVTDAKWNATGPAGPGLYAESTLFGRFPAAVQELAPHIGVSIRGMGRGTEGVAEGRNGKIIEEITAARSVDFVTMPGAGGQVVNLFESYRSPKPIEKEVIIVTEKEAQELRDTIAVLKQQLEESEADAFVLQQAALTASAENLVRETLAGIEMQQPSRDRLHAQLVERVIIKDGAIDEAAYVALIKQAAKEELDYVASVATVSESTGEVRGMGNTGAPSGTASLYESMLSLFLATGKSPAEAEHLATIAAQGR